MSIRDYKSREGVAISRDMDVVSNEAVYIGNGQGCRTVWFWSVGQARKFIKVHRKKMIISKDGGIRGLIPDHICCSCQCRYSYGTLEWHRFPPYACKNKKQELKDLAFNW